MKKSSGFEFPREKVEVLQRARRLEWITIAYFASTTVVVYLAAGTSQAMKTQWVDDMLSLVPPIVFLLASRIAVWEPTEQFPYGYHRAVSIAFLCASVALTTMGGWLLIESVINLVKAERPAVGGITIFGYTFWQGWAMMAALLYGGIPSMILGRMKLPLAEPLHDKVLHVDATMNKADWMAAGAALIGVVGIGLGFWWADSAAAAIISLDIIHDGATNLKQVIFDLMDQAPKTVDRADTDPLPERVRQHLESLPWIKQAEVRMREEGHVYFGEAFIVLAGDVKDLANKLDAVGKNLPAIDWRLHDLAIAVVPEL